MAEASSPVPLVPRAALLTAWLEHKPGRSVETPGFPAASEHLPTDETAPSVAVLTPEGQEGHHHSLHILEAGGEGRVVGVGTASGHSSGSLWPVVLRPSRASARAPHPVGGGPLGPAAPAQHTHQFAWGCPPRAPRASCRSPAPWGGKCLGMCGCRRQTLLKSGC